MAEANRRNVSFYPVNPGGLAAFDTPISERVIPNKNAPMSQTILGQDQDRLRSRIEALKTLADNTDGLAVVDTNDLDAGLRRVAERRVGVLPARLLLDEHQDRRRLPAHSGADEAAGDHDQGQARVFRAQP